MSTSQFYGIELADDGPEFPCLACKYEGNDTTLVGTYKDYDELSDGKHVPLGLAECHTCGYTSWFNNEFYWIAGLQGAYGTGEFALVTEQCDSEVQLKD